MIKPLFQISNIDTEASDKLSFDFKESDGPSDLLQLSERSSALLSSLFDELVPNRHIDFCTAGELSIHQLINYAVTLCGISKVYISSWAIKEDPARALLSLKETGKIKELYGVFDYRIKTLDAKHFHLIESAFTKYALTKNHAKVVVIIGQNLSICIVSSANLSNNPRIEAGFISTVKPTVEFHQSWMQRVIDGKTVY